MHLIQNVRRALAKLRYREFYRIYRQFSNFTMISSSAYVQNLMLCKEVASVRGAIVECGTWKGGMIAGIAQLLGDERDYFLFDSFTGLPPAAPIDGTAARKWQQDTKSAFYYDNCTASEEDAFAAMTLAGVPSATIVKGWFEDTLPIAEFPSGISILRMDADWYDSTMQILDALFPAVVAGGRILIDDYYTWDGCSKAVHDYLSKHKRPERINSRGGVCFIEKRAVDADA